MFKKTSSKSIAEMPATIVPNEYGIGATLILPDRPEPPKRREARFMTKEQVMTEKLGGCTEADFERAIHFEGELKFPAAGRRANASGNRITLLWRDDAVDEWIGKVREHAALLARLVK